MGKKLQITIDDGPEPKGEVLDSILAEIKSRSVKAAFFNIGQEVQSSPDAAIKITDAGHVLGNHSWDHLEPKTSDYSDQAIKNQFSDTHDQVKASTGVTMAHWRAPRRQEVDRLERLLVGPWQTLHADPL